MHGALIIYGIVSKAGGLVTTWVQSTTDTVALSQDIGWPMVAALFLRAYSLGGSTYAGPEAIANNVNLLAEPRVRTAERRCSMSASHWRSPLAAWSFCT